MNGNGVAAALLLLGTIAGVDGRGQVISGQAAAGQNKPELSTRDTPATFRTKVNLVMVPVVVRNSSGKAIGTLEKEDFQLFDKGKLQVISRFSVEKAGDPGIRAETATDASLEQDAGNTAAAAAAPIAQHFIVYLFDDVHTTTADLAQARQAAMRHITETIDPLTRAAIFTTSGQGNVDFTDDRVQLQQALLRLMARPTIGAAGSECPDLTYYMADMIVNKNDSTALQAGAQEALATCAPPPPSNPAPRRSKHCSRRK